MAHALGQAWLVSPHFTSKIQGFFTNFGFSSEIEQTDGVEWVLDSRTKTHRTSNKQLLLDGGVFEPAAMGASVKFDVFSSSGCWSIRTERFKVQRILYNDNNFGEQTSIIISVAQLARDHGFVAIFEPTCCRVRDPRTEKDIGEGRLRDGKYVLDYLLIGQAQVWQQTTVRLLRLTDRSILPNNECTNAGRCRCSLAATGYQRSGIRRAAIVWVPTMPQVS